MLEAEKFYQAKIKNYSLKKSKNGHLELELLFTVSDDDGEKINMFSHHYFSGGAKEFTEKLINEVLGFKGGPYYKLANGTRSDLLDIEKSYKVKLVATDYDSNKLKIKWIGSDVSKSFNNLTEEEAMNEFYALDHDETLTAEDGIPF